MCVTLIYAILFRRRLPFMPRLRVWATLGLGLLLAAGPSLAQESPNFEEYRDTEYNYAFLYPADWELRKLPEGEANKEMRVALRGVNGSLFTVVIAKSKKTLSRAEFKSHPRRSEIVDDMMRQTIDQIYRAITKNIGAEGMKIGERRDLSNATGVKFYISTLNTRKTGKPIVVAGIHAFPFARNYSINFMLTAFLDRTSKKENELLTAVFNSFHLLGEPSDSANGSSSSEPSTEKAEPK
jgi:hypothetical protein